MEQHQDQAWERQPAQKQDQKTAEHRRELPWDRLSGAGLTARTISAGHSLLDLPPERLKDLAGWIGNQNMAALLQAQGPLLEETDFRLPTGEAETEPCPAPEGMPQQAAPQGLAEPIAGQAFDPAYL